MFRNFSTLITFFLGLPHFNFFLSFIPIYILYKMNSRWYFPINLFPTFVYYSSLLAAFFDFLFFFLHTIFLPVSPSYPYFFNWKPAQFYHRPFLNLSVVRPLFSPSRPQLYFARRYFDGSKTMHLCAHFFFKIGCTCNSTKNKITFLNNIK